MAILPGRRLGPYEILSAIGAGGMGEVYKARDTRLDRIVAIKVLPTHLADRPELRERFEREAKTIASLNHPHICTLYDTGHQDEIDFLVMEYLEGETLAQRLLKGPLPIDQVLQFAIEISDALDKAHRKGITHRDLKPGNIMLTRSGTKLLDFGLAKLKQEVAPANVPLSDLPTAKDPLTAEGTLLGTLQYMAPEQVEGKEVDARTDIFAFGAVAYEMTTGKRAFEGKTQASLIAKILEINPPPISSLQPMTPQALDRLVTKCLAKEPEKRWQAASDVCDELKWIAQDGSQLGLPTASAKGTNLRGRWALLFGAGTLLLGATIASLAVWNLKPVHPSTVIRSVFALPPGQRFPEMTRPSVVISPDGKQLVYVASGSGAEQLYVHSMDSFDAKVIPGTEGASGPFFSPDSQWIGFFAGGKLKKVAIGGGSATTLCDAGDPRGAAWGPDGMIVFSASGGGVLSVVPAAGGTPQPLTSLDSKKGEGTHRWPAFTLDGKAVIFNATFYNAQSAAAPLAVYVLKNGGRRDLIPEGMQPRIAPSGHILFSQGGTLMAAPFDSVRLQVRGAAVPVIEGVAQAAATGATQYSFSDNGSLVYIPGNAQQTKQSKLVWVDRKGTEQLLAAPAHNFSRPRVSPDGRRIAVAIAESGNQIWIYDLIRETLVRLTFEGNTNLDPVWTPDGMRVAFQSAPPGNIFWQAADGSGKAERLTTNENVQIPNSWSPDGQMLAIAEANPITGRDIWMFRLSDHKAQPFLQTPFNEGAPAFSPDGHWLAYGSDESGRTEIYVQPYPGPGGKWEISTDGGTEPAWNNNGQELFYRQGNKMMAVDVATRSSFSAGEPKMLFEGQYVVSATPSARNYDVSSDVQRFLMIKTLDAEQPTAQINVVQNWFEELKQKVPTGKK